MPSVVGLLEQHELAARSSQLAVESTHCARGTDRIRDDSADLTESRT